MQQDMGALWRQDVLRRMHEAELAEAARRPAPGPHGRITVRWRALVAWLRGCIRRGSPLGAQSEPAEIRPEIDDGPVGVWEEAVRACERALAARPDLVGVWVGLSLAAGRLGDLEMAEGAYEVAQVLSPGEAEAWRDALQRDFPEIHLPDSVENELVVRASRSNDNILDAGRPVGTP